MKVAEKRKENADIKRKQLDKDKKRANDLSVVLAGLETDQREAMEEYQEKLRPAREEFERKTESINTLYKGKLSTVQESIDAAKKELLEIGDRQRKTMFDIKGNWNFENGYYLHAKAETVVKTGDGFDLSKFVKKFVQYIDWKFKVAPLKKLLTNGDERKRIKIDVYDIELSSKETLEVKKLAATEKEVD